MLIKQLGQFPDDFATLINLPGIGRSTAGAILSIAYKQAYPILDGNVRRVLARYHAVSGWPGLTAVNKNLWELSSQYTPQTRVADYTQAMMDLGATVCTRSKPDCPACPVSAACAALRQQRVNELPTPKKGHRVPNKSCIFLILKNDQQQIFLEKRPASGIWGGLWGFPEFASIAAAHDWCMQHQIIPGEQHVLPEQKHTFSHFHLYYTPLKISCLNPKNNVMEAGRSVWYKAGQIEKLGLPVPVSQLLQQIFETNEEK